MVEVGKEDMNEKAEAEEIAVVAVDDDECERGGAAVGSDEVLEERLLGRPILLNRFEMY